MFVIKGAVRCGCKSVDSGARLPAFASQPCHLLGRSSFYLSVFVCKIIIIIMVPIDSDNNSDLIMQPTEAKGIHTPKALATEPERRQKQGQLLVTKLH